MLLTTVCFVFVNILIKFVGDDLPVFETGFLRFLFGILLFIPLFGQALKLQMTPRLWRLSIGRAFVHGLGMVAWFFAMARIPMAEVTAMNFMNPVYVTLGAVLFFGEKIALPRISAMVIAVVGGLVILRPGFREVEPGHWAMILTALFFAASYLFANRLSKEVSAVMVVFLMSVMVPVFLAPFALLNWVTPTANELILLFFTAVFATLAHYAMTRAFACAPQSVLQPVMFVQLIWSVIAGMIIFDEGIDLMVLFGGGMIMASVTFIAWREARVKARK